MMERDKRAKVEVAPYDSLVGGQVLVPDHVRKIAELVADGRDKEKVMTDRSLPNAKSQRRHPSE